MSGKALIVSLHDAHPLSQVKIQEQIEFLASFGVAKSSILIVPSFHHQGSLAEKPEFCQAAGRWQEAGHELVLHGYFHDRKSSPRETLSTLFWTRLYTNQEAEFLDLPMEEARERITWGLDLFKKLGWKTSGFVAPAWLMPVTVEKLLAEMGFAYTTRLKQIIRLNPSQRIATQSLCYSTRAAWRRVASGLWNKHLFTSLRKTNLVRLSLHPNDLAFPLPRRQISQIVRACVKAGFEPTTYGEYVTR
jgi:predicted deacetylase